MALATLNLGVRFSPVELGVASVLFLELFIRLGEPIGRIAGEPRRPAPMRSSIHLLLGVLLLGCLYLSIGLVGLAYRLPVMGLTGGAALAASIRCLPRLRTLGLVPHFRDVLSPWSAVPILGLVLLIGIASTPTVFANPFCEDALVYHLGYAWQSLMAHRIPLTHVTMLFHQPLLVDITYLLPMCLGDDRLAKVTSSLCVAASGLFIQGWFSARRMVSVGWLPLLLFLTADNVIACGLAPKNDLGAAAFVVVGAILWRQRQHVIGGLLLGAAIATKLTTGAFVLAWILAFPAGANPLWNWMVVGIPVLPWLLKSYLATGDPVFPAAWRLGVTPFWNSVNQQSLTDVSPWITGFHSSKDGFSTWGLETLHAFPVEVLALPLLILFAAEHRAVVAIVLGGLVTGLLATNTRYLLPGVWLITMPIADWYVRLSKGKRSTLMAFIVIGSVANLLKSGQLSSIPWSHITKSPASIRARELTTLGRISEKLTISGAERVLLVGGWRTYPLPCRVLFNGYWGETPLIWSTVRTSNSQEVLRRRFRQLGATLLLENIVSVDYTLHYQQRFQWTSRMLKQYGAFCSDRLSVLGLPDAVDRANGGFYLCSWSSTARVVPSKSHIVLPGAEAALADADTARLKGDFSSALKAFDKLKMAAPPVRFFESKRAEVYLAQKEWKKAHALLALGSQERYVDLTNLLNLGFCELQLGLLKQATQTYAHALSVYGTSDGALYYSSLAHSMSAKEDLRKGHTDEARRNIAESRRLAGGISHDGGIVTTLQMSELLTGIEESSHGAERQDHHVRPVRSPD